MNSMPLLTDALLRWTLPPRSTYWRVNSSPILRRNGCDLGGVDPPKLGDDGDHAIDY